jgi:hypothetical protein
MGNLWGLGVVRVYKPGHLVQSGYFLPAKRLLLHHPACAKLKQIIPIAIGGAEQYEPVRYRSRCERERTQVSIIPSYLEQKAIESTVSHPFCNVRVVAPKMR